MALVGTDEILHKSGVDKQQKNPQDCRRARGFFIEHNIIIQSRCIENFKILTACDKMIKCFPTGAEIRF